MHDLVFSASGGVGPDGADPIRRGGGARRRTIRGRAPAWPATSMASWRRWPQRLRPAPG